MKVNKSNKEEIENAQQQVEALLPTKWGSFTISAHTADKEEYSPHIVLKHPELDVEKPVYVRIHSECLTGDIFHSTKCDCGQQLNRALQLIAERKGVLIYLRQEGRGIGIINKLKAYKHQEQGLDTIEANEALGLKPDYRKYGIAAEILRALKISKVNLITNNPDKIDSLQNDHIEVVERIPMVIPPNEDNEGYLKTKEDSMGHLLS